MFPPKEERGCVRDRMVVGFTTFSPGTPVSSTNKIDCHDITEILLKVPLNTIKSTSHPKEGC